MAVESGGGGKVCGAEEDQRMVSNDDNAVRDIRLDMGTPSLVVYWERAKASTWAYRLASAAPITTSPSLPATSAAGAVPTNDDDEPSDAIENPRIAKPAVVPLGVTNQLRRKILRLYERARI